MKSTLLGLLCVTWPWATLLPLFPGAPGLTGLPSCLGVFPFALLFAWNTLPTFPWPSPSHRSSLSHVSSSERPSLTMGSMAPGAQKSISLFHFLHGISCYLQFLFVHTVMSTSPDLNTKILRTGILSCLQSVLKWSRHAVGTQQVNSGIGNFPGFF